MKTSIKEDLILLTQKYSGLRNFALNNLKIDGDVIQFALDFSECQISKQAIDAIINRLKQYLNQQYSYIQQIKIMVVNNDKYEAKSPGNNATIVAESDRIMATALGGPDHKKTITGVKKIISICSSKGGVGKSNISLGLALALQNQGYKVGLADIDIYGSSIPLMVNAQGYKVEIQENKMLPYLYQADAGMGNSEWLKIMSMGFLIDSNLPLMWRGPMLTKSLTQLLFGTNWGQLDYLILDTPPGSGDVHITLFTNIAIDGAVLVSMPNYLAINGVIKINEMLNKFGLKLLGIIENMTQDGNITNHLYAENQLNIINKIPFIPEIFYGNGLERDLFLNASYFEKAIDQIKAL